MESSDSAGAVDLSGHVAVVTGANHGIGAATAAALARCGAAVLITYLRTSAPQDLPERYRANRLRGPDEVLAAIRDEGGRAIALEADLRQPDTPGRLFDFAEAQLGAVDILVNNASGWIADTFGEGRAHMVGAPIARVSASTHDQVFSVDARAGALMIAEFARRHIERHGSWGRIIGLTSGGPLGFPTEVSYGAAKAAMSNYTMAAAFELARHGVTANTVYPPVTDTGWVTEAVVAHVERTPELIHIVQPAEVAEVILYLCSNGARLITANTIHLR
jgi:3-oxoacyl-[acyl-carrier protein] reductase